MTRALAAIILGLAIFAGWQTMKVSRVETALATEQRDRKADNEKAERAAREATEAELTRANKLANDTTKALDEAHQATENARTDAVRARMSRDGMRQYAADLAARADQASCDPAPAGPSPSASSPARVLADLFSGADEMASKYAEFADLAHAAGTACERIHGAAVSAQD